MPWNGEIAITGEITTPTWITFVANTIPSDSVLAGNPASSDGNWFSSVVLTQLNAFGDFSAPQVCSPTGNCFLLANFFGCGGLFGCNETTAEGFGYLGRGMPAPILVSDATNVFDIDTSLSANAPFYFELSVDLPDGLGIEVLREHNTPKFISAEATTPAPGALTLFASGLAMLGLVSWRRKQRGIR